MTEEPGHQDVPRFALVAAAVLVLGTTILAGIARRTDIGTTHVPEAGIVQGRDLRFEDLADGGVAGRDADTGQVVQRFAPGTNAFARGVLRGLARERRRESFGQEQPFRLTHWSDGRLSLDDPATGRHVDLEVFGPTNSAVFTGLMSAATPSS